MVGQLEVCDVLHMSDQGTWLDAIGMAYLRLSQDVFGKYNILRIGFCSEECGVGFRQLIYVPTRWCCLLVFFSIF